MSFLNYVDARVWWIPQIPLHPFYVPVKTVYDLFQFENNIKPDFCNAGGLEVQEELNDEWYEYHDEDDRDIDEILLEGVKHD